MKSTMTALRRIVSRPTPTEPVHFHLGQDGRPAVCDAPRCESPGFDVRGDWRTHES
jgi:hypothetical protein